MDMTVQFLLGFAVACSAAIGLFFLRFWTRTHDRLFLLFALAFWLLSLGWLAQSVAMFYTDRHSPGEVHGTDETTYLVYVPRLLAFACIIWGIVEKNRATRAQSNSPTRA